MTITDYFTVCVVLYFITIDALKENKETLLLKMNKNIVLFLPTLHSLVCIKVRHFGHGYEHSVFKERGEEIFWVSLGWVEQTLPKSSVRSNCRTWVAFHPFPSNFIVQFILNVTRVIYHRS